MFVGPVGGSVWVLVLDVLLKFPTCCFWHVLQMYFGHVFDLLRLVHVTKAFHK